MEFDAIYQGLITGEEKLALVGLGYVGMPLAVEFAKHVPVIGFDINEKRVNEYANGIDATNEVGEAIKNTTVEFTSDASRLKESKFLIVAVPTPVNPDNTPDLRPIEGASRTVGQNLTPGSIVVFESTVYPGVTEDICIPIIEKESGLKCGEDWKIGNSPERINPGDCVHTLTNIRKIVSGMDEESAREIQKIYNIVIKAGTFPVSTIKTAEAVKVIENSQRDINIAFMNELSIIFNKMGIDTKSVPRWNVHDQFSMVLQDTWLFEGTVRENLVYNMQGITDEQLDREGVDDRAAAEGFCRLLEGAERPLLVAYNAQFDLNFLYYLLKPLGLVSVLRKPRFLDALTVYRDRRDYPHKLCNAIEAYGLTEAENSHRAVDDARATVLLLEAMAAEKDDLMRYIDLFGTHPKYGMSGKKIASVTYCPQPYDRRAPLYELAHTM